MNVSAERRLTALGITLPAAPKPLGAYVPAVQVGELVFLSGTLPLAGEGIDSHGRWCDEPASWSMCRGGDDLVDSVIGNSLELRGSRITIPRSV